VREYEGSGRPVIRVEGLSKAFRIPEEQMHTLKERVLHPTRRSGYHSFRALEDINFDVRDGEFFGIVGRNGSGKSTLLKCLAGIYSADRGKIWITGRMSPFIELGVGFNPDLAAYDNVVLNGIMLGLSPREARSRYQHVIEFAELEEFQELKLKNYSSGMYVRLAFSVAIQVDADVLLIDEVLAVGDASFQQKCFDVFNSLRDEGKTIVLVTHDMGAVTRFCHRAVLLEHGDMVFEGDPEEVANHYLELNFKRENDGEQQALGEPWGGSGAARLLGVWCEAADGSRPAMFPQGQELTVCARVQFIEDVEDPALGVAFRNEDNVLALVVNSARQVERSGRFAAGEEAIFSVGFENALAPGRYDLVAEISKLGRGLEVIARSDRDVSVVVKGAHAQGGVFDIPVSAVIDRAPAADRGRVEVGG
jgi:ABC-type polysaccharide/polyol phosphate transport system ATPase subunit